MKGKYIIRKKMLKRRKKYFILYFDFVALRLFCNNNQTPKGINSKGIFVLKYANCALTENMYVNIIPKENDKKRQQDEGFSF